MISILLLKAVGIQSGSLDDDTVQKERRVKATGEIPRKNT